MDDDFALEEVVVTATRQSDTVNRVALAVTAASQDDLDKRGIMDIADLVGVVPGLSIAGREASGNVNVAIRSVRQQTATAATTGFYLDETSLQKRSAATFAAQNGTPVPPLFDLERVEVLRGPQGTLFGGGSEGGTIRYIQARPSLTEYSGYGRAQWMSTKGGDPSYEGGVAFGGPIVEGKLGFRASIFARETGGYIDLASYRDGSVYDKHANNGQVRAGRVAMTWAPTDRTELTLQYLKSVDKTDHLGNSYNLPETGQIVVDPLCFNHNEILSRPPEARAFLFPPMVLPSIACLGVPNTYIAPGFTVGPLEPERFHSYAMGHTPTRSDMELGSGIFEWRLRDDLTLTSVSSFTFDLSRGQSPQNFPATFIVYPGTGRIENPGVAPIPLPQGSGLNPNMTASVNGLDLGAMIRTNTNNRRNVFSQELRLASAPENILSYVVGVYYSNARARVTQYAEASDEAFQQLTGLTIAERYGIPFEGFFSNIYESIQDVEQAAFADLTWRATDKLRLSAGLRVTYVTTDYTQYNYGPNAFAASPSDTLVTGRISETPVTPKFSVQYFFTPESQMYVTAAKGFRPGGVNQALTSAADGFLSQYGRTREVLPRIYDSDSVWSYELGGKTGFWDGRGQVNAAIFHLDWKDVQTYLFMGDGAVFNVPKARSRGVEVEAQVRPVRPLTLNAAVQRTNAKYASTLFIPSGPDAVNGNGLTVARDGQKFAQPAWTVDLGAQYSFNFGTIGNGYFRVDYRWFDDYYTVAPGTQQFSPDSSKVPAQKSINLRLGLQLDAFDLNLFALNVTDEKKGAQTGGRSQCQNADCSDYLGYVYGKTIFAPTPRQVGLQLTWRP